MTPNGYNLTEGGDGISNPSEEIININRIKHLGKKQSEETKAKKNAKLRKVIHTEEWIRKISEANKGQIISEHQRLLSSQVHKNTSWYNDGVREFMLFDYEVTPDLIKGRLKNPFPDQEGIPKSESLKKKISDTKLNQKYHWYNNGIEELFLSEESNIPDNYKLGRLKGFVNKVK